MSSSAELEQRLEREITLLIVEVVQWNDLRPEHIDAEQPLFAEGLGLDSLDALNIATALARRYGVTFEEEGELAEAAPFSCVKTLTQFVAASISRAGTDRRT